MDRPIVTFIYNAPAATEATRAVAIAICFLGCTRFQRPSFKPQEAEDSGHKYGPGLYRQSPLQLVLSRHPGLWHYRCRLCHRRDIGVAAVLNMCFIYREIGYVIEVKVILKNIVSAAVMGVAMYFMYLSLQPYRPLLGPLPIVYHRIGHLHWRHGLKRRRHPSGCCQNALYRPIHLNSSDITKGAAL